MSLPEHYTTDRPYECPTCGGPSRIRGACNSCSHPLPIRCAHCARVKYLPPDYSSDWQDHPGKVAGEVDVECPTCAAEMRKRSREAYWREARRVDRWAREPHNVAPMRDSDWADLAKGE